MDYYLFEVRIPGETVAVLVALMIVNIDDNAPIIQMLAPCEIAVSGWTLIHLWLRAKPWETLIIESFEICIAVENISFLNTTAFESFIKQWLEKVPNRKIYR